MQALKLRSIATAAGRPWGPVRDDSDESLMLRYQNGEVRAFEVLVQRHRRRIFHFVFRSVYIVALAEDLTQECFLRVVRGAQTYAPGAKFTTWLYAIARNLCIDESRRHKLRKTTSLDVPVYADSKTNKVDQVVGHGLAADREVISSQLSERMREAIAELPEEQREVFLLREISDLQFNEIAEVVGVPENTVKSRMRYALEKLREALEEYRDLAEAAR